MDILFLTYLAVGAVDQSTRDWLIYAQLIVHKALWHGGRGWLDYDHLFRQQAVLGPTLAWNSLHPSFVALTILGQQSGGGIFCSISQAVDHLPPVCHGLSPSTKSCRHDREAWPVRLFSLLVLE